MGSPTWTSWPSGLPRSRGRRLMAWGLPFSSLGIASLLSALGLAFWMVLFYGGVWCRRLWCFFCSREFMAEFEATSTQCSAPFFLFPAHTPTHPLLPEVTKQDEGKGFMPVTGASLGVRCDFALCHELNPLVTGGINTTRESHPSYYT